jgi:hypothetical protein
MAREIEVSYTDATDVDAIRDAAQVSRTRLVRIETPANSTWDIANPPRQPVVRGAHERRTRRVQVCAPDYPATCREGSGRLWDEVRTGAYGASLPPSSFG